MIHVTIAVKQVALQSCSRSLLSIPRCLRFLLIIPITVVPEKTVVVTEFTDTLGRNYLPRGSMRFPWSQTHPAKISFARLILTHHVVATTILFDCNLALGTLLLNLLKIRQYLSKSLLQNINLHKQQNFVNYAGPYWC